MADAETLRAAYDEQLCGRLPERLRDGMCAERDGPLVRTTGGLRGGMVDYRDLGGREGAALDALIREQVEIFERRGESFEWKTHGHDSPADLPDRLRMAGFVAEPLETVLVAPLGAIPGEPSPPPGVTLREIGDDVDLERVEAVESEIWGIDHGGLAAMLSGWRAFDPGGFRVVVAEAGGEVVCAGWLHVVHGTAFARLHGGGTLPEWRGRGVYRALVAMRAGLACEAGCRYLQVDASTASRPILERLGFTAIASTTPFRWSPAGSQERNRW